MRVYRSDDIRLSTSHDVYEAGTFNKITLKITGFDEPNNGRMLHMVSLYVNGEEKTTEYLGNWNRICYDLNRFQFSDSEGRYCFIPAESGWFLIDTRSKKKIDLGRSDCFYFAGNTFFGNKHLVITQNFLIRTNLETGLTDRISFEKDSLIEWAYFINEKTIRLIHYFSNKCSLYDVEKGRITETRSIMEGAGFEDTFRWIVWHHCIENGKNVLDMVWVGKDTNKDREGFRSEE